MYRSIRKKNHNIQEIQNAAKCFLLCTSLIFGGAQFSFAQTPVPIYSVTAANGNGIRFWESDNWKMHMGTGPEYAYGPVSGYSIKINMDATAGRGWTWGHSGLTPVAALSNTGEMKIANHFESMGNIVSYRASSGYLALASDLPGYSSGIYPTLQTNGTYIFFSASGKYSGFIGDSQPRFGLNDANGATKVVLHSNGSSYFTGGNVGIGTTSPSSKLDVVGSGGADVNLKVNGRIQTGDSNNFGGMWLNGAGTMFVGQQTPNSIGFYSNGDWRLVVNSEGKIGIGTYSPDQKLTVKGKIHAEEVIIDLSVPAPDYVFEKLYDLKPLTEVKKFIDENKHLPEVPSAKEMEKDGVKVGEMEMILLKKIEELTLYVIELKEANEKQARENEKQSQEIAELKKNK